MAMERLLTLSSGCLASSTHTGSKPRLLSAILLLALLLVSCEAVQHNVRGSQQQPTWVPGTAQPQHPTQHIPLDRHNRAGRSIRVDTSKDVPSQGHDALSPAIASTTHDVTLGPGMGSSDRNGSDGLNGSQVHRFDVQKGTGNEDAAGGSSPDVVKDLKDSWPQLDEDKLREDLDKAYRNGADTSNNDTAPRPVDSWPQLDEDKLRADLDKAYRNDDGGAETQDAASRDNPIDSWPQLDEDKLRADLDKAYTNGADSSDDGTAQNPIDSWPQWDEDKLRSDLDKAYTDGAAPSTEDTYAVEPDSGGNSPEVDPWDGGVSTEWYSGSPGADVIGWDTAVPAGGEGDGAFDEQGGVGAGGLFGADPADLKPLEDWSKEGEVISQELPVVDIHSFQNISDTIHQVQNDTDLQSKLLDWLHAAPGDPGQVADSFADLYLPLLPEWDLACETDDECVQVANPGTADTSSSVGGAYYCHKQPDPQMMGDSGFVDGEFNVTRGDAGAPGGEQGGDAQVPFPDSSNPAGALPVPTSFMPGYCVPCWLACMQCVTQGDGSTADAASATEDMCPTWQPTDQAIFVSKCEKCGCNKALDGCASDADCAAGTFCKRAQPSSERGTCTSCYDCGLDTPLPAITPSVTTLIMNSSCMTSSCHIPDRSMFPAAGLPSHPTDTCVGRQSVVLIYKTHEDFMAVNRSTMGLQLEAPSDVVKVLKRQTILGQDLEVNAGQARFTFANLDLNRNHAVNTIEFVKLLRLQHPYKILCKPRTVQDMVPEFNDTRSEWLTATAMLPGCPCYAESWYNFQLQLEELAQGADTGDLAAASKGRRSGGLAGDMLSRGATDQKKVWLGQTVLAHCGAGYRCSLRSSQLLHHVYGPLKVSEAQGVCVPCLLGEYCDDFQFEKTALEMQNCYKLHSLSEQLAGELDWLKDGQQDQSTYDAGLGGSIEHLCSSFSPCPKGQYCPDPKTRLACPPGFFCPQGSITQGSCNYTLVFDEDSDSPYAQPYMVVQEPSELLLSKVVLQQQAPLGGNVCPANSSAPYNPCPAGYYCPNETVSLLCPPGHFCPKYSVKPKRCFFMYRCPRGSKNPVLSLPGLGALTLGLLAVPLLLQVLAWRSARQQQQQKVQDNLLEFLTRLGLHSHNVLLTGPPSSGTHDGAGNPWAHYTRRRARPPGWLAPLRRAVLRVFRRLRGRSHSGRWAPLDSIDLDSLPFSHSTRGVNPQQNGVTGAGHQEMHGGGANSGGVDSSGFAEIKQQLTITCKGVNVVLPSGQQVLRSVTGVWQPGMMHGVMGPSGCGKSTLLEVLAARRTLSSGSVELLHSESGTSSAFSDLQYLAGFVPQADILQDTLTVRENLLYSARLRLPAGTSQQEMEAVVRAVLVLLALVPAQHNVVGSVEHRGISGGQRKRVNVGVELVARPSLLFLDEPTSGLDSAVAHDVLGSLSRMADVGMNVLLVIHQPRNAIFCMLDTLMLLGHGGRVVYQGPAALAQSYFSSLGFIMPLNENPADLFLDITTGAVPRSSDPDFMPDDLFLLWDKAGTQWVQEGGTEGGSTVDLSLAVRVTAAKPIRRGRGSAHKPLAEVTDPETGPQIEMTTGAYTTSAFAAVANEEFPDVSRDQAGAQRANTVSDVVIGIGYQPGSASASTSSLSAAESGTAASGRANMNGKLVTIPLHANGTPQHTSYDAPANMADGVAQLPAVEGTAARLASRVDSTYLQHDTPWRPCDLQSIQDMFDVSCEGTGQLTLEQFVQFWSGMRTLLPPSRFVAMLRQLVVDFGVGPDMPVGREQFMSIMKEKLWDMMHVATLDEPQRDAGYNDGTAFLLGLVHLEDSGIGGEDGEEEEEDVVLTDEEILQLLLDKQESQPAAGWLLRNTTLVKSQAQRVLDSVNPVSGVRRAARLVRESCRDFWAACTGQELRGRRVPNLGAQTWIVLLRSCTKWINARDKLLQDMVLLAFTGTLIGAVKKFPENVQKLPHNTLMAVMCYGIISCVSAVRTFSDENLHFLEREAPNGLSTLAYFTGKAVFDLLDITLRPFIYLSCYYFMTGQEVSFASFYLIMLAVTWYCYGLGYVVSMALPAQVGMIAAVALPLILGGLVNGVNPSSCEQRGDPLLSLMAPVSFTRWAVEGVLIRYVIEAYAQKYLVVQGVGLLALFGYCEMDIKLGGGGPSKGCGLGAGWDGIGGLSELKSQNVGGLGPSWGLMDADLAEKTDGNITWQDLLKKNVSDITNMASGQTSDHVVSPTLNALLQAVSQQPPVVGAAAGSGAVLLNQYGNETLAGLLSTLGQGQGQADTHSAPAAVPQNVTSLRDVLEYYHFNTTVSAGGDSGGQTGFEAVHLLRDIYHQPSLVQHYCQPYFLNSLTWLLLLGLLVRMLALIALKIRVWRRQC